MRFLRAASGQERERLTRALFSLLFLIVLNVGTVRADEPGDQPQPNEDSATICSRELMELDPAPVSEVATILKRVKQHCVDETACGTTELKEVLEKIIVTQGKGHRNWFRKLTIIPRRLLVMGIYSGTVIGPGLLTYYLTSLYNIPDGQRIILGASVSQISGMLLGRSGAALERMLGPHIEQAVIKIWDPNDGDSWGKIQKALNEKDRLINSQIYNQLLIFAPHFRSAGDAIKRKDIAQAADSYTQALLHSYNLFGGLHYYHPSTVGEVRQYLPRGGQFRNDIDMPLEQKVELIIRVCRTLQSRPADEIVEGVNRDDLVRFAFGIMLRWLVVHDAPAPSPVKTPTAPVATQGLPTAAIAR